MSARSCYIRCMHRLGLPILILAATTGCPADDTGNVTGDGDSTGGNDTSSTPPATSPPNVTVTASAGSTDGADTGSDGTDGTDTGTDGADTSTGGDTNGEDTSTGGDTTGDASTTGGDTEGEESSSTGDCDGVTCDGECIDPETNTDFCGAEADCMGVNAGMVCPPSAECQNSACVDTCDNCSFELGDFTDWTVLDLDTPFVANQVAPDGTDLTKFFSATTATDGMFGAAHGFDGDGGSGGTSEITIGQDVDLRMDAPADLVFDYRAAWDLVTFGPGMIGRTFEVRIEPAGGGVPMESVLLETAMPDTMGDTSVTDATVDMSAYAGETVFVNFVWTVPEDQTGPAQAELDNIRFVAQ